MSKKFEKSRKVVAFRPDEQTEEIISGIEKTLGWTRQDIMVELVKKFGQGFLDEKIGEILRNYETVSGKAPAAVAA